MSVTLAIGEAICERALEVGRKAGLNPLTVVVLTPGGRLVLYKSQARAPSPRCSALDAGRKPLCISLHAGL